jgi:hypothetical protein
MLCARVVGDQLYAKPVRIASAAATTFQALHRTPTLDLSLHGSVLRRAGGRAGAAAVLPGQPSAYDAVAPRGNCHSSAQEKLTCTWRTVPRCTVSQASSWRTSTYSPDSLPDSTLHSSLRNTRVESSSRVRLISPDP